MSEETFQNTTETDVIVEEAPAEAQAQTQAEQTQAQAEQAQQAQAQAQQAQAQAQQGRAQARSAQEGFFDPSYVQENVTYYQANYRNYHEFGNAGFNWAAFFLTPWWFFYRKLYIIGLAMFAVQSLPGIGLIANFFSGFLANRWYFQEMDRSLAIGDRSNAGVHKWIIYVAIGLCVLGVLALWAMAALTITSFRLASGGYWH